MVAPIKSGGPTTDASHAAGELAGPQYAMPTSITSAVRSASLTTPMPAAATAPSAHELVERPPEHTLARGIHEATPAVIWLIVVVGALIVLFGALYRVRRIQRAKQRALASANASFRRSRSSGQAR